MESIDITDAAFSLNISPITDDLRHTIISGGGNGTSEDYTMYMYIGAAILVSFIGIFYFKFYKNKKLHKNEDLELDCPGGFCTMDQKQV